jgi:hypothetical protein
MAQGDATSVGYPEGTPSRFLSSHATSRNSGGTPIDAQDITHALVGPFDFRQVIVTAGTRVALAATTKARQVMVQSAEGNGGGIVVGGSTVVATLATRRGFWLPAPGDWTMVECSDLADVYVDGTYSGDVVSGMYWTL